MNEAQISSAVGYNRRQDHPVSTWRKIQALVGADVDGVPGGQTALMVSAWQADLGLEVDGKVGPVTLAAMRPLLTSPPSPESAPPRQGGTRDTRAIAEGETGRDVIIDVSFYQGAIDWRAVAEHAQLGGAIIKCTQSRTKRGGMKPFEDSRFRANVGGARAAGVEHGLYHLAVVTRGDGSIVSPRDDAEYVALSVAGRIGALGLWVDWETTWVRDAIKTLGSAKAAADWMIEHLQHIERLTGRRPGVYWSHRGVRALGDEAKRLRGYRHWWAYYYGDASPLPSPLASRPGKPAAWDWSIWQFTSSGRCVGIEGDVDVCVVNGRVEDLTGTGGCP